MAHAGDGGFVHHATVGADLSGEFDGDMVTGNAGEGVDCVFAGRADFVFERAGRGGELDRKTDFVAGDDDVFDHFARYEIAAEFGLLDGTKGVEDARLGQCIARKECHVCSHAYSMNMLHCTTPDYSLSGKACSDEG